ncbi:hypothetical protein ANCDUO_04166 [Ancylostoma duodenale]|uniref:Uncharacterized protein n=1 Tax=Ancylostoma duodenale TaxID=51022 RepID=A0A0C2H1R6_9BILA|nr:hypothetical protein ANCDUO_04166 [Ancylostoma duodenale]
MWSILLAFARFVKKRRQLALATPLDYVFLVVGSLASFIHGAGFSVLGIVLGGMTTIFLRAQNSEFVLGEGKTDPNGLPGVTRKEFDDQVKLFCYYYLGLGIAMFTTSYVQVCAVLTLIDCLLTDGY